MNIRVSGMADLNFWLIVDCSKKGDLLLPNEAEAVKFFGMRDFIFSDYVTIVTIGGRNQCEIYSMNTSIKEHWENIYTTKQPNDVSWTQQVPTTSLEFIHAYNIPKTAKIIDIGGGDSKLVDYLLMDGYKNISVLDISSAAINRAKKRLGDRATEVKWIVSDILDFQPTEKYDVWHDRAAFHFQTEPNKIDSYLKILHTAVDGIVIIGTFSIDGTKKCSGLVVKQYEEKSMIELFEQHCFKNISCKSEDHVTPAGATQNFIICSFTNKSIIKIT